MTAGGSKRSTAKQSRPALAYRNPIACTLTLLPGPEPWVRVLLADGSSFLIPGAMPAWEVVMAASRRRVSRCPVTLEEYRAERFGKAR